MAAGRGKQMKYSILVPVYNMEKYLPQCIESVLAQQVADFELILTNDRAIKRSLLDKSIAVEMIIARCTT